MIKVPENLVWVRALFWLSHCALARPFLCVYAVRELKFSAVSYSSYKDISPIGLGPHPYGLI